MISSEESAFQFRLGRAVNISSDFCKSLHFSAPEFAEFCREGWITHLCTSDATYKARRQAAAAAAVRRTGTRFYQSAEDPVRSGLARSVAGLRFGKCRACERMRGILLKVFDVGGEVRELIPLDARTSHFSPEFRGASYLERYNILCRKLAQERLYTTATIIASPRSAVTSGDYYYLSELTSLKTFVTSFAGHIAAEAAR